MEEKDARGNLSVQAAAAEIGISPHTLRAWLRQRRLGYVRAGRRVLVPLAEVQAFLNRNRVPASEENPLIRRTDSRS
jgi:excisionase family DNA binding protein